MINDTTSGSTSGSLFDGSTGVLDSLSADTRAELERRVQEVHLPAGTKVFETGDTGDALYLVRSGLVDLTTGPAEDQRLTTVAPGDFFGEQSLLTGRPRAATAVAQTGVTLWRLDHSDFLVLMGSDPELGAAVARTLSDRLRTGRTESDGSARADHRARGASAVGRGRVVRVVLGGVRKPAARDARRPCLWSGLYVGWMLVAAGHVRAPARRARRRGRTLRFESMHSSSWCAVRRSRSTRSRVPTASS